MAGTSLLALIDDIATLLDDVSVMTKVAAQKTAGVLGDDLALNAEQVTGVNADRELPVVFAVAKGSLINKAILVPAALAISVFANWLIVPLLMLGGSFLCFEGFEKVAHKFLHRKDEDEEEHEDLLEAVSNVEVDMVAFEKEKVKGAVRTDFILSAEIIVITLGTVESADLQSRILVLVTIAVVMTLGVYGLVAGIVKLDDLGLAMSKRGGATATVGNWILAAAPYLMKGLGIVGTIAMFLVGGGIIVHGIPGGEKFVHDLAHMAGPLDWLANSLMGGLVGIIVGGIVLGVVTLAGKVFKKTPVEAS